MVEPSTIVQQKKEAQEQMRAAEDIAYREKQVLRKQIADLDREIAKLQRVRNQSQSDLAKLG